MFGFSVVGLVSVFLGSMLFHVGRVLLFLVLPSASWFFVVPVLYEYKKAGRTTAYVWAIVLVLQGGCIPRAKEGKSKKENTHKERRRTKRTWKIIICRLCCLL